MPCYSKKCSSETIALKVVMNEEHTFEFCENHMKEIEASIEKLIAFPNAENLVKSIVDVIHVPGKIINYVTTKGRKK